MKTPPPDAEPPRAAPKQKLTLGKVVKRILGGIVAVTLTTLLIGSAFFRPSFEGGFHLTARFPLDQWLADLPSQFGWVLLFAILTSSMAPVRAFRWGFTLPKDRKPAYWDRYHAVAIGLLGNNVIPGKVGEALRAMSLTRFTEARGTPISFSMSLGTILVCKVLDLIALLILLVLSPAGPIFGGATGFSSGFTGVIIGVPALVAVLFLLARYAPRIAAWLHRKKRYPKLQTFLREVGIGVAASGSFLRLLYALGGTLLAIALVAAGYSFALYGVGARVGFSAGVVLLTAVTLGQSPPGVPAGMGMYYLASTWAARLLGATAEQAATLAVLTHLTTVVTHIAVGGASLLIRRVKLRDYLPRGRGKKRATSSEPETRS